MSHRAFINAFYENAINGLDKTRESLAPYVSDEALHAHVEIFEKGFPRYSIQIEDFVEQDDKVVLRAHFQGTHTGDFNGIPPTGLTVDVPFLMMYRIEDGKIAQHWLEANHITLLSQLGVMESEAAPNM
jgi:predicted ester cyclase